MNDGKDCCGRGAARTGNPKEVDVPNLEPEALLEEPVLDEG